MQGSKVKFEFGSTCATRCKFLGAQLKIVGAQLAMFGASISKEKVKSLTVPHIYVIVSGNSYFYFSPVIDKRQLICYAVILLWFLALISLFDNTVCCDKRKLTLEKNAQQQWVCPTWNNL